MKPPIWKNYYDIVFLPPKPVRDYAIKLSKTRVKSGGTFMLGTKHYLPHISLYHIPVHPKKFNKFKKVVKKITSTIKIDKIKFSSELPDCIKINKLPWLQKLHNQIIKETVIFYDWPAGWDKKWHIHQLFLKHKRTIKNNLKKYGTPVCGKLFFPHITLTSFGKHTPKNWKKSKNFKQLSFRPDYIYICELGQHHSCQRIVEKIKL